MLKAHWKLEWHAHRYWFIATFSSWLICLLIGLFYKLSQGAVTPVEISLDLNGAAFTSGDNVFLTLIFFIEGSWLFIWLILFFDTGRAGVYDENRYLFFQTEIPIWKILVNKLIISAGEMTILITGVLFFTLSLATISGAELGLMFILKIILETLISFLLVNMSFFCIVCVATALSMIPVNGYRFGFIAAIIYFIVINSAQMHIGQNWLPQVGSVIHFSYSIGLEFQFSLLVFIFNILFGIFLLFLTTKILNKSADLQ
ncbi:hypothetical protein IBB73_12085 [Listeria seeligeri]|uniref:hypothetical protein n=1 Tax=Listeria seeligeri TaxID=1640 RepID=UPI001889B3B2|nr:hypothetical protein [Listeria seeligeri]MBF2656511.1 hypothetical protein [Listeria seeligeri]